MCAKRLIHAQIHVEHVPYLSASAVVIHYEEALYQVYVGLPLPIPFSMKKKRSEETQTRALRAG